MAAVKGYNFKIDLQCPQCGAPAVLNETQYIIKCSSCGTCNIIHAHPYPCYYMEPNQKKYADLKIIYIPYWRFKGLEFTLGGNIPRFRVNDISSIAVQKTSLPPALGFHSQTQRLKFVHKGINGVFIQPEISRKNILHQIGGNSDRKVYIGEILSLIFMPFYLDSHTLYDGLTGNKLAVEPPDTDAGKKPPDYNLKFTPSICPNCGWDLKGETDSLVLHCDNCMSFWLVRNRKLNRINALFFSSKKDIQLQVPFWRFHIEFSTLQLSTRANLIKTANIPKIIREKDIQQILYFYIPAFKLNPKLFLRIGKQVTMAEIEPAEVEIIRNDPFHPVDLPLEEGMQAVAPILMNLCSNKEGTWKILKHEKLKLRSCSLAYMPFHAAGSEYIQDTLGFSIPKNSLKFGRQI